MSVTHDFECRAHGTFEARVAAGDVPPCPQGCSPDFVRLVFKSAPNIGTDRVRTASRLVQEAADMQGLSDIDISPSTPGDSPADKNFKRSGNPIRPIAMPPGKYMSALTHRANELSNLGFGHPYDSREWRTDQKTGTRLHYAAPPIAPVPMNQFGIEMTRVREK